MTSECTWKFSVGELTLLLWIDKIKYLWHILKDTGIEIPLTNKYKLV